jgi:ADP-L-glycero-D-manno-heptose 6-epimerase
MVWQLARQMKEGNPRIFKHGEQRRDYIYVDDVVRANLLAAQAKQSCVVNCGFGGAISFNDLIGLLNEALGTRRVPEYIDNPYADQYQSHTECDMTLAKEKLGFVPKFDIRSGLAAYLQSGFLL